VLRRTKLRTIFEIYADDDKAVAAFHQVRLQNQLGKIADGQNPTTIHTSVLNKIDESFCCWPR
jgi:hypothetical protein